MLRIHLTYESTGPLNFCNDQLHRRVCVEIYFAKWKDFKLVRSYAKKQPIKMNLVNLSSLYIQRQILHLSFFFGILFFATCIFGLWKIENISLSTCTFKNFLLEWCLNQTNLKTPVLYFEFKTNCYFLKISFPYF